LSRSPGLPFPRYMADHRECEVRVPAGDLFRGQRSRLAVPGRHRGAHGDDAASGLGRKRRLEPAPLHAIAYRQVEEVHLMITLGQDRAATRLLEAAQLAVPQEAFLLALDVTQDVNPDQGPELVRWVIEGGRVRLLAAADQLVDAAVHDREQQLLLGREMVVQRGRAHAGPFPDITDGCPVVAVLRHRHDGRGQHDARPGTVDGGDGGGVSYRSGLGLAAVRGGSAPATGPAAAVGHDGAGRSLRSSPRHVFSLSDVHLLMAELSDRLRQEDGIVARPYEDITLSV